MVLRVKRSSLIQKIIRTFSWRKERDSLPGRNAEEGTLEVARFIRMVFSVPSGL